LPPWQYECLFECQLCLLGSELGGLSVIEQSPVSLIRSSLLNQTSLMLKDIIIRSEMLQLYDFYLQDGLIGLAIYVL
jgi:hypothetical protein